MLGICNITVELLQAGGAAMTPGLHADFTVVGQSGTIPFNWKVGGVRPYVERDIVPAGLQQLLF